MTEEVFAKISKSIKVEMEITGHEFFELFASLCEDQQAEFFNSLGAKPWLPMQLQYVTDSPKLTNDGRHAMEMIGQYGPKQKP